LNPFSKRRAGTTSFRFGVHVSIAGGIDRIFGRGEALSCSAVQLFSHSSRSWEFQIPEPGALSSYKDLRHSSPVSQVFVHASYLINIASQDEKVRCRSIETLRKELLMADLLLADGLVLHPGSAKSGDRAEALERASLVIQQVLDDLPEVRTPLLLENTAGAGSMLGSNPNEMKTLFDRVDRPDRMGLCLDSCHLYASGFDLACPAEYEKIVNDFLQAVPSGTLSLWHLNDALFVRGSGRDRHAGLGEGTIGIPALTRIVRDAVSENIPVILETPKGEGEALDRMNLRRLCQMAEIPVPECLVDAH
jgi:deoxyribonuclease-4